MYNIQYVIEHGVLMFKHTRSEFLFLQDISKLKELATADGKKGDCGPTTIEFEMIKVSLKPFVRQTRSVRNEWVSIDNISFHTKSHLWNYSKDTKDATEEHIQLTVENRSVILSVKDLKNDEKD